MTHVRVTASQIKTNAVGWRNLPTTCRKIDTQSSHLFSSLLAYQIPLNQSLPLPNVKHYTHLIHGVSGPVFIMWTEVLLQDLMKSLSRGVRSSTVPVAPKFDRC